jgi:transposase
MRGVFDMADCDKGKPYSSRVAIDVAKDYNAVMVERRDGTRKKFRMANNASDHDKLVEFIWELPQPCRIGFEATGNYHRVLGFRLASEGFGIP